MYLCSLQRGKHTLLLLIYLYINYMSKSMFQIHLRCTYTEKRMISLPSFLYTVDSCMESLYSMFFVLSVLQHCVENLLRFEADSFGLFTEILRHLGCMKPLLHPISQQPTSIGSPDRTVKNNGSGTIHYTKTSLVSSVETKFSSNSQEKCQRS